MSTADALEAAWASRVRGNREQVARFGEVRDSADFYAPSVARFVEDPRRTDDPVLDALLGLARPDDAWLDIGAGAGRFALPLAAGPALDPDRRCPGSAAARGTPAPGDSRRRGRAAAGRSAGGRAGHLGPGWPRSAAGRVAQLSEER